MPPEPCAPTSPTHGELWPPARRAWRPAAHRVYFVAELVEKRDLRPRLTPSGDLTQGPGPAAPQRLGAASRPIARRLHEDLACRGRAATTPPDFRTIRDGRTQAWSHGDTWPWTAGTSRPRPRSTRRCATTGGCRRRGTAYGTRPPKPMPGTTTDGTHRTEDELPVERAFREGRRRTIREARELAGPRPGRSRCPRPNGPSPTRRAESCPPSAPRAASSQAIPAKPWSMRRHRSSSPPPCRKPRRTSPTRSRGCSRRSPIRARAPRPPGLAAGYVREDPGRALTAVGGMPRIPPERPPHERPCPAAPRGRTPTGLAVADRRRRTQPGRCRDAKRTATVEPVVGPMTPGRGARPCLWRDQHHVRGEWARLGTTHNVLKRWRTARRHPAPEACRV